MSKILFLFCNEFSPSGDIVFILPELTAWSLSVDRIVLFSAKKSDTGSICLPSSFEIVELQMPLDWKISLSRFLFYCLLLLFQRRFWIELRDIIWVSPHLKNVYCAVSKYAYQKQAEHKVRQYLAEHPVAEEDDVILYSYWLDYIAGLAAELHIPGKNLIRIARAHGYDLYDETPGNGYMPWRRDRISRLDHVYTASKAGADFLKKRFPDMKDKISCAYLGSEDFSFQEYVPSNTFRLISCSGLVPVKRVELIIEALSQIRDIPIKWTHIGTGPEEEKLKSLGKKILAPNIQCDWRGNLIHEQVKNVYQIECFDLFVSTSASEGLPVSMMEALSCGIPVAGTSVGGVPELIHENKNGWLLNPDAPAVDLVKAIRRYAESIPSAREEIRKESRSVWEIGFDAEKNQRKFVARVIGESAK